jgi:hypothetical protein
MATLSWNDQPEFLRDATEITHFFAKRGIHIYKLGAKYYLTTGNLFGSQTIETGDVEVLLKCVGIAASHEQGSKDVNIPDGATIVAA